MQAEAAASRSHKSRCEPPPPKLQRIEENTSHKTDTTGSTQVPAKRKGTAIHVNLSKRAHIAAPRAEHSQDQPAIDQTEVDSGDPLPPLINSSHMPTDTPEQLEAAQAMAYRVKQWEINI